jgi:ribose 1,5-bisphosphokinase
LSVADAPRAEALAGVFVAVVGPSGAGKDSIIRAAAEKLSGDPEIVFVRRIVTREADENEAHETADAATFEALRKGGAFALSWAANGLQYGLPASLVDDLAAGRVVVANLSRDSVTEARGRFPRSVIVHVTASVEALRDRLSRRARETEDDRDLRIARSLMREQAVSADIRIENNGPLEDAVERFVGVLVALVHHPAARR